MTAALVTTLLVATGSVSAQTAGPLSPGRRKTPRRAARPAAPQSGETIMIKGRLVEVYTTSLLVETTDGNNIQVILSPGTRFILEDRIITVETLKVGDDVAVHGVKQTPGKISAIQVTVRLGSLIKASTTLPTLIRSETEPSPPINDDDGGPPTLRRRKPGERGRPAPRSENSGTEGSTPEAEPAEPAPADPEPPPTIAEAAPPATAPRAPPTVVALPEIDPVIARTREWVFSYSERPPNFICREVMTRMTKQGYQGWHTLDVVEADIVYEDHKESYRNIKINGKPVKSEMDQLEGSWSTGEFASTLISIFAPGSQTRFRFSRFSDVAGLPVKVYKFSISEPNSRWHVEAQHETITPAYDGTVWIHEETAQVLRIESHAVDLPEDFELDAIEVTVDYNRIRISGGEYLLPVKSDNLGCWRGTGRCARNSIEFRNYRRFSAESTIVTTDSSIDYEGESADPTVDATDAK